MALLETELGDGSIANIKAGSYLGTEGTIVFTNTEAEDDGLFLRINENGGVVGYRAVNQDLEWIATDTTSMSIANDTWVDVLSLTVDHDVTAANGSFVFYASVDNLSGTQDANITIQFKADGTVIGTPPMVIVDKGDLGRPINMFNAVGTDIASGSTITVEMWSTQDLNLRGDMSPTTLKVTEAQAAPVTAMATVEQELVVPSVPGRRLPPKQDVINALGTVGQSNMIDTNFQALVTDKNRFFQIFYDANNDVFFGNEIYQLI